MLEVSDNLKHASMMVALSYVCSLGSCYPLLPSFQNNSSVLMKENNFSYYISETNNMASINSSVSIGDNVLASLQKLSDLEKYVDTSVVNVVRKLVLSLCMQPELFPLENRGIQLEYDGNNNSYLEFEVYNKEVVNMFMIDRDGNEHYKTFNCLSQEIDKIIRDFYAI